MPDSLHPQEKFGLWLGLIARLWRAEVDRRLAPFGLTQSRWLTLLHLARLDGPVTQRTLADVVGVREPTLVRTLDWLEAEGLIERRVATEDRRSKLIHVTSRAAPILSRIKETTAVVRAEIFSDISEAEIATCQGVFERIAAKLGGTPALIGLPSAPGEDASINRT